MNRLGQDPDWIERQRAAADVITPVRFGPDVPPISEQLGLAPEDCETEQMALDVIVEVYAKGDITIQKAAILREEIVESLTRRLRPDLNVIGRDHRNRQGDLI